MSSEIKVASDFNSSAVFRLKSSTDGTAKNSYNFNLYKYTSVSALLNAVNDMKTYFEKSISIISHGIVTNRTLELLLNMRAMTRPKLLAGEFIIITKEHIQSLADDKQKFQQVLKNRVSKLSQPLAANQKFIKEFDISNKKTLEMNHNKKWSADDLNKIFGKSLKETAKILGRTPAAISYQRFEMNKKNKKDNDIKSRVFEGPKRTQKFDLKNTNFKKTFFQEVVHEKNQSQKIDKYIVTKDISDMQNPNHIFEMDNGFYLLIKTK